MDVYEIKFDDMILVGKEDDLIDSWIGAIKNYENGDYNEYSFKWIDYLMCSKLNLFQVKYKNNGTEVGFSEIQNHENCCNKAAMM